MQQSAISVNIINISKEWIKFDCCLFQKAVFSLVSPPGKFHARTIYHIPVNFPNIIFIGLLNVELTRFVPPNPPIVAGNAEKDKSAS
jgi:hypothetical protein